jgi:CheY-like chemotaxis protein
MVASLSADIPQVLMGDPVRLNQVLNNLVDNSIKFTESGQVAVSITRESQHNNQVSLLFTIQDTGIGIPEDKMTAIFESFTQANNDITRKYGGTGLGLAIAKRLVEAQGGKLWLKSEPNAGTTFYVELSFPVAADDSAQHQAADSGVSSDNTIRVLVAEDNEVNQLIISKVLQAKKLQVTLVSDGQQTLDELQQNDYDIVLMDIQMPGMDGYTAIKQIRSSQQSFNHIPIIALTAHAIKAEIEKCMAAGANDHVSKPFQAEDLVAKIENLVSEYRLQR